MRTALLRLLFVICAFPLLIGADKEGGIIGTGVVGQITGLGQFEVSGMKFEIDKDVSIQGLESLRELDMGMTFAVRAKREGDDWFATHIRRVHVVVGPVTSNSEVMGIPVIGELPEGGRVRVDGFWSEEGIVASLIEPVADGEDSITGPIDQIERVGELLSADGTPLTIKEEGIITLNGLYESGKFTVNSSSTGLFDGEEPNLLMAEGYFSKPDKDGESSFLVTGARSAAQQNDPQGQQSKSVRCSYNGRTDFDFTEIQMPERETAIALCSSLPR